VADQIAVRDQALEQLPRKELADLETEIVSPVLFARQTAAPLQPHVSPARLERTSPSAMIAIGIRARLLVSEAPAVCSARRRFRRDMTAAGALTSNSSANATRT